MNEGRNVTQPRRRQTGYYEIDARDLRRGEEVVVLPDAVPNAQAASGPAMVQYGWVRGVLPSPSPYDLYLVRFFIPHNNATRGYFAFRVVAYVDRYARVFEASDPVLAPPARYPDLAFARYHGKGSGDGCVQTYNESGKPTILAQYRCRGDEYTLFDSWFNFRAYRGMSLDEAISRSYFALVWRPRFMNKEVPSRGLRVIDRLLGGRDAVMTMRRASKFLGKAEADEALMPPAPARCLNKWMLDAGLEGAFKIARGANNHSGVLLRQQVEYSNQYNLVMDDDSPLPERTVWKLESALNRYEMLVDGLGDKAATSSMEQCAKADRDLRERFALQFGEDLTPKDHGADKPAGEWDVRLGISREMEEALVPYRFAAAFRANVEEGIVAFELLVPDADMAPTSLWRGVANEGRWVDQGRDDQALAAREYAQRMGLMLASIAAKQSERIHRVALTAEWFYEVEQDREGEVLAQDGRDHSHGMHEGAAFEALGPWASDGEGGRVVYAPTEGDGTTMTAIASGTTTGHEHERRRTALHDPSADHAYSVIVDCDYLRQPGNFRLAVENPMSYFAWLPRLSEAFVQADIEPDAFDEPNPFWLVTKQPDYKQHFELPDLNPRSYSSSSARALGCDTSEGLAINYNAPQRNMAEHVAERLAGLGSISEGIAALRNVQSESNDPDVLQACTRLMTMLAQGDLRMSDQNEVVSNFLGRDRFEEALQACRKALLKHVQTQVADGNAGEGAVGPDVRKAIDELGRLVDETMAAGVFADDARTVYRVFDSSTSRIFYNLAQTGRLVVRGLTESAVRDSGKRVRLAPDSYYYCCIELVRLLERSFNRSDDALRYGHEAVRLAPTMPAGYRQLARSYMLVGDLGQAHDLLVTALRFAYGANEISWLYYQLAYVEWKSGRVRSAQACYLKAIAESVSIANVAGGELHEMLMSERVSIMRAEDVDKTLTAAGIPLAPTSEIMDALRAAGHAAVDEGAFLAARNVLLTEFHHRPDDALMHVLRSLDR